jgi:beta-galactosidase/beta-glucuronidase
MRTIFILCFPMTVFSLLGNEWEPVDVRLASRWAQEVTPGNVWQEYPRPQFQRADWLNLNGLWDFALQKKADPQPEAFEDKILVPFCVESSLSGVGKKVTPEDRLWYRRTFQLPEDWEAKEVVLHFEAVDYATVVWVNGVYIGSHKGAFDRFSLKITPYLRQDGLQEIVVAVDDPTSFGTQPRGKQSLHGAKITTYTPVSGIWQTVWLEAVSPEAYLGEARVIPDIDREMVSILPLLDEASRTGHTVQITVSAGITLVAETTVPAHEPSEIKIPSPRLWSPDDPFLYDLHLALLNPEGNIIDEVESYFGMRKISLGDRNGSKYLFLNNKPLFHCGPLDQGWWPAGLMTPPSDEAMRYDIEITKQMGFNMIRKHVKVEPDRWYYHCDKLGMLVWQDMPSGMAAVDVNAKGKAKPVPRTLKTGPDAHRTTMDAAQFEWELRRMIDLHINAPSIVMWVVFNEGWGQYETIRVTEFVEAYDPSRLISAASGWANRPIGDIHDIHSYEVETQVPPRFKDKASVLGEYGGIGWPIEEHIWDLDKQYWGYQVVYSGEELLRDYQAMFDQVLDMQRTKGLSAAVYTQITDIEGEMNGLMTYDRELIKIPVESLRKIHAQLFEENE